MGVVLYKLGRSHIIDGWECDFSTFDTEILDLNARLAEGWFLTPDCGRKKQNGMPEWIEIEAPEETESDEQTKAETEEIIEEQPEKIVLNESINESLESTIQEMKKMRKMTHFNLRKKALSLGISPISKSKPQLRSDIFKTVYLKKYDNPDEITTKLIVEFLTYKIINALSILELRYYCMWLGINYSRVRKDKLKEKLLKTWRKLKNELQN